ncbi:hypothetical protein EDD66_102123 [Mobilisporobacter senegalensis]|uniref:Lipoprotein n=1 Tax=Mobilisporobacter senegalensis TaxID=1329262 RepID=A0A3N1XZ07_9FIRM|nr:hypothetical protein [Mobilisporobacter senegalensis]ROR30472.1 hypothetical protein EDD66_102123 [Mobilisporobacter senegalensis]
MKKKLILSTLVVASIISLTACKQTDVVGKESINSFQKVLNAVPDSITADNDNNGWSLRAPDESARFIWSKDFSSSSMYDAMIEFDAKPFIDAGLDVTKLPEGMINEDKILIGADLGDESLTYDGEATPLESYKKIVDLKRDSVTYHKALDHYGISLSNGNVFEWAKDMDKNDKDIVFALNPEIFINAGVDPEKVDGWVFAKVEVMDMNGKDIEVDKFLKPFNLQ